MDRTISALQDPTRRRILLDFYVHQREWTAAEVAEAVGVHRTVAHGHLERLVALGYLLSGQRRGTSGKPAKLYRLAGRQIDLSYPVRRFARLSALLAEGLRGTPDGIRAAHEAGRRFGTSLVSKRADSPEAVLATALIHLMPGFEILTGDDSIRRIPYQRRVSQAGQLFELTLRVIVSRVESSNVISEGAWTQRQIVQARELLGPDPFFVILRIDERERQKRESSRRDRQLGHPWDPSWHDMPGPDDLYDLVVDSKSMGIRDSAELDAEPPSSGGRTSCGSDLIPSSCRAPW